MGRRSDLPASERASPNKFRNTTHGFLFKKSEVIPETERKTNIFQSIQPRPVPSWRNKRKSANTSVLTSEFGNQLNMWLILVFIYGCVCMLNIWIKQITSWHSRPAMSARLPSLLGSWLSKLWWSIHGFGFAPYSAFRESNVLLTVTWVGSKAWTKSCLLAKISRGQTDSSFSPNRDSSSLPASATLLVSAESITYTRASVLGK